MRRSLVRALWTFAAGAAFLGLPAEVRAQEHPPAVLEVGGGWVGFADDGVVSEGAVTGAARVYLGSRVSVGPEFTHIAGENHSHQVLTGNLTWDIRRTTSGGVQPFVVVGAGMFRTRQIFFDDTFTHTEGAFTVGGGVRVPVGSRALVGADARIGWELHLRVTGFVGVRLGDSR